MAEERRHGGLHLPTSMITPSTQLVCSLNDNVVLGLAQSVTAIAQGGG